MRQNKKFMNASSAIALVLNQFFYYVRDYYDKIHGMSPIDVFERNKLTLPNGLG